MDDLKMYFLLKMGIFQPAMLVYQRVNKTMFFPNDLKLRIEADTLLQAFLETFMTWQDQGPRRGFCSFSVEKWEVQRSQVENIKETIITLFLLDMFQK